jgi:hypothetical protein
MPSLFDKVPQTLTRDALGSLSKSALAGASNAVGLANKALAGINPGQALKDLAKGALGKDSVTIPDTVSIPNALSMKKAAKNAAKAAAKLKNSALAASYKGVLEGIQASAASGAGSLDLKIPTAGVGKEAGDFLKEQGYKIKENVVKGVTKMTVGW